MNNRNNNLKLGSVGEKVALKFLKQHHYQIIKTNFQNKKGRRLGEIDIIAKKNKKLIFIEVKTREIKKYNYILPEENINFNKIKRLQKIIQYYLSQTQQENIPWRLDAVSIWITKEKYPINNPHNIFPEQNIHYFHLRSYFFKTIAHCWIKYIKNIFL